MNTDYYLIALIAIGAFSITLLVMVMLMHRKLKRFLVDVEAHNIAESLSHIQSDLNNLQNFRKDTEDYLSSAEKRLQRSIQSVHTVRFNPFHGTGEGGNQSFATTFLNEQGDGATISSLYSRDRVSVFAKPIKGFASEHEMSEEEKESLDKARNKLTNLSTGSR